MANTLNPATVQLFLDSLEFGEEFGVIFLTNSGEQRCYIGSLQLGEKRDSIPIQLSESGLWKRFNRNQVLWIGYPDQIEGIKESLLERGSI